jgi:hypothetical protein
MLSCICSLSAATDSSCLFWWLSCCCCCWHAAWLEWPGSHIQLLLLLLACFLHAVIRCRNSDGDADWHKRLCGHTQLLLLLLLFVLLLLLLI